MVFIPSATWAQDGTPPTVWGYASPSRIVADVGTTVVHWGSLRADYCSYGGSRYPISGSARLGPYPAGDHSATFSCTGSGGTTYKTIRWTAYVPEPEVFASVRPASVYTGQTVILSWHSTNADSCSRGGTRGSVTEGPWSTPGVKSLSVTCTGAGGRDTDTVRVTVTRAPRPVITASLSPAVIEAGTGTTVGTWSATNADYCTYGGDRLSASGRSTLGPYPAGTRTFTFTFTCTGPGGTSLPKTLTLRILRPPTATATVSPARVKAGTGRATLTWSSTNAASCIRDGRTLALSGYESVGPFTNTTATARTVALTVVCANDLRSASSSASLTVDPALPTVTATVSPAEVAAEADTATLTWSSTNAATCSYGDTTGITGSVTIEPYAANETGTKTLTVTCTNDLGDVSDSVILKVGSPPPVFNYVGFDHHYKAWRKPRSHDYFIGRDPSAPGNGGVTGFYLREARTGKTDDHFYNLEYPVTREDAVDEGFIIASDLRMKLHDINLDGQMDLIIEGLKDRVLNRSNVIVYARAGTGGFPAAGYTEMGPTFRQIMEDLNSWGIDNSYFDDNALRTQIPVVNRRMIDPTPYTKKPTTLPSRCQDGRHYCEIVHGSDGLPSNPTPMGFEYVYRSDLREARDPGWDGDGGWSGFSFGENNFYVAVFQFQEVFTGSGSDIEQVTELDYSAFNGADEIAADINIIGMSENAILDAPARAKAVSVLRRIFGTDTGDPADIVYLDDFFLSLSIWATIFASYIVDVTGNQEVDDFVLSTKVLGRLSSRLASGNNEYAICIIRDADGDLQVYIWTNNDESQLLEGDNDYQVSTRKPVFSEDDGREVVAVVHSHPESSHPNTPEGRRQTLGDRNFFAGFTNACRELPGPEDHRMLSGKNIRIPNYFVTPTGVVRVLERYNGRYRVRTVTPNQPDIREQEFERRGDVFKIPAQENFVIGYSGDCNQEPERS